MFYCKVIDNQIVEGPYRLPDGITDETANDNNWYRMVYLNMPHDVEPDCNPVTELITMQLTFTGSTVECSHVITDKSPEDVEASLDLHMRMLREQRNEKLLKCDWTQLPNAPLTEEKKVEWENYRNQLRDFPQTVDFSNIIWPTEPV